MVTTSVYYNAFMQETVLESGSPETINLLSKASIECTFTMMTMYFNEHPDVLDYKERIKTLALLYQGFGYGILDLNDLSENGGIAKIVHSNVVELLVKQFNKEKGEICHYTNGFILGGAASVYKKRANHFKIDKILDYNNYGYSLKLEVE
jgi:hypothetical protein